MSERPKYPVKRSNEDWTILLDKIKNSGSYNNKYTFTRSFASDTSFLHIGDLSEDLTSFNMYGNVEAAPYSKYWSMESQSSLTFSRSTKARQWISTVALGDGVVSLIYRTWVNGKGAVTEYLAFQISGGKNGVSELRRLYNHSIDDHGDEFLPGEIVHGGFLSDAQDDAMVRYYFSKKKKQGSLFEIWSTPSEGKAPIKHDTVDDTSALK